MDSSIASNKPHIDRARERFAWIRNVGGHFESVIDFGAGDCSAALICKSQFGLEKVTVVDASVRTQRMANGFGIPCVSRIEDAPLSDLIFSAHSIEHVHDFIQVMKSFLSRIPVGGLCFCETPNIANVNIWSSMTHTPHTFMLSEHSFMRLAHPLPMEILTSEATGPFWSRHYKNLKVDAKTDLRVLLKRTA